VSYQLAEDVVKRSTTNGLSMLFDRSKGVMYELNETASTVVEMLGTGSHTVEALLGPLTEQFDAPAEEIAEDIGKMLEDFTDAGLVLAHDEEPQ
jgi:hypothetical protein